MFKAFVLTLLVGCVDQPATEQIAPSPDLHYPRTWLGRADDGSGVVIMSQTDYAELIATMKHADTWMRHSEALLDQCGALDTE